MWHMSRKYNLTIPDAHPDHALHEAILELNATGIQHAIDNGADPNYHVIWPIREITPLFEAVTAPPFNELPEIIPDLAELISRGHLTETAYETYLRKLVRILVENGASPLNRDSWLRCPADEGFAYTGSEQHVEALAQLVMHSLHAAQAKEEIWQPDLTGIFLTVGGKPDNETGNAKRELVAITLQATARRVAERLECPEELVDERVTDNLPRGERDFWHGLAQQAIDPRIMPRPSEKFLLLQDELEMMDATMNEAIFRYNEPAAHSILTESIGIRRLAGEERTANWLQNKIGKFGF